MKKITLGILFLPLDSSFIKCHDETVIAKNFYNKIVY